MPKSVASHEEHTGLRLFLWTDGERVGGHYSFYSGFRRVAALNDYSFHEIAFGENPHENTFPKYRHGADIARDHCLGNFQDKLISVGTISVLVFDQVTDSHGAPLA